jgi:hypothetical protein
VFLLIACLVLLPLAVYTTVHLGIESDRYFRHYYATVNPEADIYGNPNAEYLPLPYFFTIGVTVAGIIWVLFLFCAWLLIHREPYWRRREDW